VPGAFPSAEHRYERFRYENRAPIARESCCSKKPAVTPFSGSVAGAGLASQGSRFSPFGYAR
jgi:hypothetical protein